VKDQAGRVSLGVAADDEDLVAHLGEASEGVLRGGGLADTTLTIERNLAHLKDLLCAVLPFNRGPETLDPPKGIARRGGAGHDTSHAFISATYPRALSRNQRAKPDFLVKRLKIQALARSR
jgi:hypothetical protein